ncbi:hypothetical protein C5167_045346 [Papaver somniferum]|uniref:Uncharacterized protein n=1 Tax=Papaver somniferum TaxID=3469 RepID=A0A4Y7LD44_PAPSO|nr:hypothetical protein C5167_045346 [Papaver somniferum]
MLSKKMRTLRENKEIDDDHTVSTLPEELVTENILTRLPGRTLAQWSCISAIEPVGYCNGLACATGVRKSANDPRLMLVMNPGRRETLSLPYLSQ